MEYKLRSLFGLSSLSGILCLGLEVADPGPDVVMKRLVSGVLGGVELGDRKLLESLVILPDEGDHVLDELLGELDLLGVQVVVIDVIITALDPAFLVVSVLLLIPPSRVSI